MKTETTRDKTQQTQKTKTCGTNCNRCQGSCSQKAEHQGQHRCNGGHSWA